MDGRRGNRAGILWFPKAFVEHSTNQASKIASLMSAEPSPPSERVWKVSYLNTLVYASGVDRNRLFTLARRNHCVSHKEFLP
jgi:hypothetical protein